MSNISQDIKDAIQKSLPSMVGNELQAFIADAEKTKILYDSIVAEFKLKLERLSKVEAELEELQKLSLRKGELDEIQRNQKVVLAESKAENSLLLAKQAFDLVHAVFRNPVTTETLLETVPLAVNYSGGGSAVQYHDKQEITTKEVK